MLPCHQCAYRKPIPGNCHIACSFAWAKASLEVLSQFPENQGSEKTARWFLFPFNFDPCWGPDECPAKAEKADPEMVAQYGPLIELITLLA